MLPVYAIQSARPRHYTSSIHLDYRSKTFGLCFPFAQSSQRVLTMTEKVLTSTSLTGLKKIAEGKVRDLYEIDSKILLFVASDRISAYDVIMQNVPYYLPPLLTLNNQSFQGIPSKGTLLTLLSVHWFELLPTLIPNLRTHFLTLDLPSSIPEPERITLQNRSMQVRRLKIFPIEAI